MPMYKYIAKDFDSKKVTGKVEANDRKELATFLRTKDQYLIDCTNVTKADEKNYKMKLNELSDFSRQLGTMLGSGISLIRAMSILVQRDAKPQLTKIYTDIYRKLQQGFTLSTAMQEQGKAFPELMVNMYRSGESSGQMEKTAMTMATQYEKDFRLRNKLKNASIYPIILICVTILVVIIIFTFILPSFSQMFGDMDLPFVTTMMMGVSTAMTKYWYWMIIGALCIVAFISVSLKNPKVRRKVDYWKLRVPKVGKMMRVIYTARFARTMCSLYSSGISIINALMIVKDTVGNKYIEEQFDQVIASIRNGTSLSQSIQNIDGFDTKLASSIYVGEESGKLDNMLTSLADDFDYDAEIASQKMVTILEPVMIIFLAVIICVIMMSVLLPVFQMYQNPSSIGG